VIFILMKARTDGSRFCDLGDSIRSRRTELGIAQADLARLSGVSLHSISDLETGKGNPTLASLERLLEVLGLTLRLVPAEPAAGETSVPGRGETP
jgi:y4mF family transcriptional regulator